jgi:hypothetical protein
MQGDCFADIAVKQVEASELAPILKDAGELGWLASGSRRPEASITENDFGQPTITLHRDALFRIEIIQWTSAMAGKHHHGGAGAFCPIRGDRLNVEYDLKLRDTVNDTVKTAIMKPRRFDLLSCGSTKPIYLRLRSTHALFFLEELCTTLTVRMVDYDRSFPAFAFIGRELAYAEKNNGLDALQRLETLQNIELYSQENYSDALVRTVTFIPISQALRILVQLYSAGKNVEAAVDIVARRLAVDMGALIDALEIERRQRRLALARDFFTERKHRDVLAVLWAADSLAEAKAAWHEVSGCSLDNGTFAHHLNEMLRMAFVEEPPLQNRPLGFEPDVATEMFIERACQGERHLNVPYQLRSSAIFQSIMR